MVTKVVGIDPSERSARIARKRIAAAPFPIEIIGLSAEKIPVADTSFESIVSTFTMCSIPDVAGALREMRRVLHPEGRLYFVEHALNRRISQLITQAGFEIERLEHDYLKGAPKFAGFLYRGVAKRAAS